MARLAANVYGEALYELALEHENVAELMEEVIQLDSIFSDNEEFVKLLNHPRIETQKKQDLVKDVLADKVSKEVMGLLSVVIEKGHAKEMRDIFLYFIHRCKEYLRIGVVWITSAVSLTSVQQDSIYRRLLTLTSYEKLEMNYLTDASLIGGLIIRINDRVVDSSIRTKLEKLSCALKQ
ncbi:MAG: ATP synthase F1 subunit delta [Lachnospiraceae bacterium]